MRCFVAKLKEIGCSSGDGKYLLKCEKIFAGALMDTRQFGLHINSHKDLHLVREILLINQVKAALSTNTLISEATYQGGMQISFGRHFGSKKVYLQCWNKKHKTRYESFSDVGEIRVYFASKILTPCRMH